MSKVDDRLREGKLPLPSPRSSDELDERILRAAREQAPITRAQRQPWWLAGAATAAMLFIAVTITWTELPSFNASEENAEPAAAAVRASTPANKMKRESSKMYEMSASMEMSDQAAAQPAAAARMGLSSDTLVEEMAAEIPLTEQLQTLSDLIRQGEGEKARIDYEALKKACRDCDLPEALEQAIAKYLKPIH